MNFQQTILNLPKTTFNQLLSLESKVIIPKFASSGVKVTEEEIRAEVYKDQSQEVHIVFRNENPRAWIRYIIKGNCLLVKSNQINQTIDSPGALRGLLREVLIALKGMTNIKIESVAFR